MQEKRKKSPIDVNLLLKKYLFIAEINVSFRFCNLFIVLIKIKLEIKNKITKKKKNPINPRPKFSPARMSLYSTSDFSKILCPKKSPSVLLGI